MLGKLSRQRRRTKRMKVVENRIILHWAAHHPEPGTPIPSSIFFVVLVLGRGGRRVGGLAG